jgi:FkbH-like protein
MDAEVNADMLLELSRAGQLAAEYPRACRIVARLRDRELPRAGRLLARADPGEVARLHPELPVVSVGITGHGTLSALTPAVTAELARHGILARPVPTGFDSYVRELGDPSSTLATARPDLVLCVLDPAMVFDEVPLPWTPEDAERALAGKVGLIERLAAGFAHAGRGTLVLNTLPLTRKYTAQLVDLRSRARLGAAWRAANIRLLELVATNPAVAVIDLDPLIAEGVPAGDERLDTYARAHLGGALLAAYAREVGHLARNLAGRTKKVLVLDLDDTLWGGVLGDDGMDGIEVGDGYRGTAFLAFQRVVKQLGSQGVLLAAVSKNDVGLVERTLRERPGMALREADFVRVVADWRPKHESITELAALLGLGVDSFVFVDDSAYERGLVRWELPGVAVVDVDDEPAEHAHRLLRDGWFDVRELTGEDRVRPQLYRAETERRSFLDSFDSLADYLRELGVEVRVSRAGDQEVARISQLTLRTNQFNLTGVRLQPQDVRELLADPLAAVWAVQVGDRFGDNGLSGAVLAHWAGDVLHLDNFLLSCRVFARSVEGACLSWVLHHAREAGAGAVYARYRPGPRNELVRDFYPRNGFRPEGADGGVLTFRHDLAEIEPVPAHIRLVERCEVP